MKLEDINGREILDYLITKHEEFDDCSLSFPLIFESQRIINGKYELRFTAHYNNWGTWQQVKDNCIFIEENGNCWVGLEEPFDGDESTDILEEILLKWLPTYVFKNQEDDFCNIIERIYERMPDLTFDNIALMDDFIQQLTLAKTMMK